MIIGITVALIRLSGVLYALNFLLIFLLIILVMSICHAQRDLAQKEKKRITVFNDILIIQWSVSIIIYYTVTHVEIN